MSNQGKFLAYMYNSYNVQITSHHSILSIQPSSSPPSSASQSSSLVFGMMFFSSSLVVVISVDILWINVVPGTFKMTGTQSNVNVQIFDLKR